jgi:hypothetical protein
MHMGGLNWGMLANSKAAGGDDVFVRAVPEGAPSAARYVPQCVSDLICLMIHATL